ncbi:MAG: ABC transporter permease [Candidatus Micrarchaeota archaeon]
MKFQDAFSYALRNMVTSSLRSWLTIIGVIIGVVALVTIMSVSEGVQRDIQQQLSAFGPTMMFIVPINMEGQNAASFSSFTSPASSGKLTERDADAIMAMPGIKSLARVNMGRSTLEFKDKTVTSGMVIGTDDSMFDIFKDDFKLESGRYFRDGERNVVVVGYDAKTKTFGKRGVEVGSTIVINGENFRVVGILQKFEGSFREHDDAMILIPYDDGKQLFAQQLSKNEVSMIYLDAYDGYDIKELKSRIEEKLAAYHRVALDEKDFSVITADFIQETVGSILTMLSAFLVLITLIASLVGALGVANTMFMGVLERTREIGVLKAMGATENDIVMIFLIESALIGLIGGLLGLLIGFLLLQVAVAFAVPVWLRLRIIAFAILFSLLVGIIAGVLPAKQAAKLDPVEALRS